MIEIRDLGKSFLRGGGEHLALQGVSLSVGAGEIGGVIGPSGAGKSTLARCVNLLERPTSGTITVAGRDLTKLSDRDLQAARRQIGTIFQSANLLSSRTVRENVALPLELAGTARSRRRSRVDELVARVGLEDHSDVYPAQLSGGQRQRVGIARALALEPVVLLSDEATSGLDPETTRSILALLAQLREDLGLTILLITHEMEVVRDICDSVTLLQNGRVAESGPLSALVLDPDSALGRALVPLRPAAEPSAGQVAWRVKYGEASGDDAWLGELGRLLGAPVSLLGASVEQVDGRLAGAVTIGVPSDAGDVGATLAALGLYGTPAERGAPGEVPA